MSEEKKQKLKEYQKKYRVAKKSSHNNEQNSFFNNYLIAYALLRFYLYWETVNKLLCFIIRVTIGFCLITGVTI